MCGGKLSRKRRGQSGIVASSSGLRTGRRRSAAAAALQITKPHFQANNDTTITAPRVPLVCDRAHPTPLPRPRGPRAARQAGRAARARRAGRRQGEARTGEGRARSARRVLRSDGWIQGRRRERAWRQWRRRRHRRALAIRRRIVALVRDARPRRRRVVRHDADRCLKRAARRRRDAHTHTPPAAQYITYDDPVPTPPSPASWWAWSWWAWSTAHASERRETVDDWLARANAQTCVQAKGARQAAARDVPRLTRARIGHWELEDRGARVDHEAARVCHASWRSPASPAHVPQQHGILAPWRVDLTGVLGVPACSGYHPGWRDRRQIAGERGGSTGRVVRCPAC